MILGYLEACVYLMEWNYLDRLRVVGMDVAFLAELTAIVGRCCWTCVEL